MSDSDGLPTNLITQVPRNAFPGRLWQEEISHLSLSAHVTAGQIAEKWTEYSAASMNEGV
jgi:hypothetical protein